MASRVFSSLSRALTWAAAASTWALAEASCPRPLSFWLCRAALPSASFCLPLASSALPSKISLWASASFSSTPASTRRFSASIFAPSICTDTCCSTRPVALTLATPSSRSKAGCTVSDTSFDTAVTSWPSMSTLAATTGSMSGLIFSIMGAPTASSSCPATRSILPDSSIMAESMLVPCSNSKMIMLEFSLDTLCTVLMPPVVPSTASRGRVTAASTFSGLAPG